MSRGNPSVRVRELSNIQLVQVCARESQNEAAWDEFVNRFDRHITVNVIRILRTNGEQSLSPELVGDLVQQVYVRLLENDRRVLKKFRGEHERSIFAYLTRLTTTVVLDYLRHRSAGRHPPELISWTEVEHRLGDSLEAIFFSLSSSGSSCFEDQLDDGVTLRDIVARLQHVLEGEHKRRDILIFVLYVFDGLTAEEIATQPGIELTPSGVRSVLVRLKEKLKKHMETGAGSQPAENFSDR
ncbi:MAG: sigma-70 family RNA polymerase sigma factor [Acidobacteria bacterium]|nr:MAG: sigma-70 family RNA polymerase sigma factor [Acidobacteriota bacterium]